MKRIAFAEASPASLRCTIDFDMIFDFEGSGFANRSAQITCPLKYADFEGIRSHRIIC